MEEILYLEILTPDIDRVRAWLQSTWKLSAGKAIVTTDGVRLQFPNFGSTVTEENTEYPEMVKWFQKMPKGKADILLYWGEKW
jgi:hypothetical protein